MRTHRPIRVFVSAAEPSGDMHAVSLMRAFRRIEPEAEFVGIAGPQMREAGCRGIADFTSRAAMLTGVVGNVRYAAGVLGEVSRLFSHEAIDAAVVLDSPMLHFPITLRARMRGIPVLYYIAPQLWAWGAYRVHKLRSRVNRVAVVLPFEEEYFRHAGIDATFVGHPLFDHLAERVVRNAMVDQIRGRGSPVVAILPGSRRHVIREVLPGQLEVARAILGRFANAHIGVSVADEGVRPLIDEIVERTRVRVSTYEGQNAELLSAAALTLVASGTATLEVAYYRSPMVVLYNGSKLMYHLLGRWLIRIKHLSLINILAGRELVPEFMPYYDSTAPISDTTIALLSSETKRSAMRDEMEQIIAPLSQPGASERVARMLRTMIALH